MERLNYYPHFEEAFNKMVEIEGLIKQCSLDHKLIHLVKIRVSQINGCAVCLDMHVKQAKIDQERELRLFHLPVWEDSPLFSQKEKAALLWAERLTQLSQSSISEEFYGKVKEHFSDKEITQLTLVISMINMWNRFGVSFKTEPGSYDKAYGLDKAGL